MKDDHARIGDDGIQSTSSRTASANRPVRISRRPSTDQIAVHVDTQELQSGLVWLSRAQALRVASDIYELLAEPADALPVEAPQHEKMHEDDQGARTQTGTPTDSLTAPANQPQVESYRVEPDVSGDGDWHVLTFSNGQQRMVFTDRPLVIVEPETH